MSPYLFPFRSTFLLFLGLNFIITLGFSQEELNADLSFKWQDQGMPYLQSWNSSEYKGDPQCFSIVQDLNGVMYFGTPAGISEFDGKNWKSISLPNQIAFSQAVSESGVVYVGGQADFGFLWPDSLGNNQFHSLLTQLPEDKRDVKQIWGTFSTSEGIFFQSFSHLIRWKPDPSGRIDQGEIHVWTIPFAFSFGAVVNDQMYFYNRNEGLHQVVGDSLIVLAGASIAEIGERFQTIWSMLPYADSSGEKILVATQEAGLFIYNGEEFLPFHSPANSYLIENQVYLRGVVLEAGIYAFNTLAGGIIVIDQKGDILRILDDDSGLLSNGVLNIYKDREDNVWATPVGQIIRTELTSPITLFSDNAADIKLGHFQEKIYFGNISGIRYKPQSKTWKTELLELPGLSTQVVGFNEIDGRFFASTRDGLFEIRDDGVFRFPDPENIGLDRNYDIIASRYIPDHWYMNFRYALVVYHPGSGELGKKVAKLDDLIQEIEEERAGVLWVSTEANKLFRIEFNPTTLDSISVQEYAQEKGLDTDGSHPTFIHDRVVFCSRKGLRELDQVQNRMIPSLVLGEKFADTTLQIGWIEKGLNGRLFIDYVLKDKSRHISVLDPLGGGGYNELLLPTKKVLYGRKFGSFLEEKPGVFWIANSREVIRYVHDSASLGPNEIFKTLIRKAYINTDSLIFGGNYIPGLTDYAQLQLPYKNNNVRFEFSATTYQTPENVWFQYRLAGNEDEWSSWTEETVKEYTNLWEGAYDFEVRARNIYDQISDPAIYHFVVLPPWYRSWWMFLIYFLLIIGFIYVLLNSQKKRQQKKHENELMREKEINDRLVQIDKLKDQFLANTSHELRTPLNGIIGITEAMLDEAKNPEDRQNLGMVVSSGKRLASLVNDLLDFSRIRNADLTLRQRPIGLRSMVEVVLQVSNHMTQGKKLTLHNDVPNDLPTVFADEDRITQVLYNLIGNGIKFTESGSVRVNARVQNAQIEIAITDTGIGIPADKREVIFNAFEQGDGSVSRTYAGTGLGLSISKNLVERHGGKMWLESIVGKGSSFYFTLPISKEPALNKPMAKALTPLMGMEPNREAEMMSQGEVEMLDEAIKKSMTEVVNILIVDDEPVNHQVLKNHLKGDRYNVFSAMNGNKALALLEKENVHFDLVLLDVMMPRMSGYEVCRQIRTKYLANELPIIMVTAKNQINDLVEGLNIGANDYLAKPFSKDEFMARLSTHLNLHGINQAMNRFIPSEFIRTLGRKTITEVKLGDNIYRDVTVLFSDIRGYTSIAEKMTPADNFRFVNSYAQRMGPIIQKNNGFVNQYLGDGIMALFQTSSSDALKASIEMQAELRLFNQEKKEHNELSIEVGMGFHTGPLIMGIIGDTERSAPAIISDTVNTAARLEGLTKYYHVKIIFSQNSYQALSDNEKEFCRYLGMVQVKGKQAPIGIYECFDGDDPEIRDLKSQSLEDFNRGIEGYLKADFDKAITAFEAVLLKNPRDETVRHFLAKSTTVKERGWEENWTGVESISEK